jgi:alcohol dehydrogenase (cytochrome c)
LPQRRTPIGRGEDLATIGIMYGEEAMKRLLALMLVSWCGSAAAQTAQELIDSGKNTENVTTFGMGYNLNQYSPLSQINKQTVKRLVPIWSTSLSNEAGELAQPTIYNGVMYVVNGAWTFAIDVATGQQIWRTPVEYDRAAARVGAPGVIIRGGATIYNGKLFREQIDAHVVALDLKTGKEIWKQKFAEYKEGYTGIIAPLVANGVVISGVAGGDRTTRGFLVGWDPDTGKKLWQRYTIPAPGEPGSETWPQDDAWKYGGGATWQNGAYDPELDLVYWGVGNAEPYNPEYRKGKDSLYTASVIAIRPKTGELVWHYQYIPNESFDFDGTAEPVLADLRIDGQVRKVLLNANKNGFMYVIDRTNGKLIAAHPFTKVNWASKIDLETGRPVLTDVYQRAVNGETVEIWPSRGTNASLMAFNPKTGLVYVNAWEIARILKYTKVNFILGQGSTGIETSFPIPPAGQPWGYHLAFDPLTGETKWKVPVTNTVLSAGMLATDGGLLFTGRLNGEFIALDQATGQELWKFKTGSGINSPPITYTHNGRQYVTVLSGIGGVLNRAMKVADRVPTGGSVWTFALMPE